MKMNTVYNEEDGTDEITFEPENDADQQVLKLLAQYMVKCKLLEEELEFAENNI